MSRYTLAVTCVAAALSGVALAQAPPTQDPPAPQGTASIAGRVVAGDTGRPAAGAMVMLGSRESIRVSRTTKTDAQGGFEFAGLVAGSYSLSAIHKRYLQTFYGQTPSLDRWSTIVLRDGERFGRADIQLSKPGAIEGHVLDEFGDPAPDILVKAYRTEFAAGARRLIVVGGPQADPTDDKGQFRFFGLAPGTYHLCAQSGAFVDEDVNNTGGFAPTFFPGTAEVSKSRGLTVTLGSARTGVTIRLVPARTGRVAGTIVHGGGAVLQRGVVRLALHDPSGMSPIVATANVGRDGTFAFRNVPAGAYSLQAVGWTASGSEVLASFGHHSFTATGEDVERLTVAIKPGVTATGRVEFDGDDVPLPRPDEVVVTAQPLPSDSSINVSSGGWLAKVREDWTFEIRDLTGWRIVQPLLFRLPAWVLSRVTLDGVDVTDTPLDFTREDVSGLEILLTTRAGAVRGTVVSSTGEPVRDYAVVVFADDRARWAYPSRFVALARPDQEGRFEAKGLPPEDYLVIAVPSVRGSEWLDPEFLEGLRADATRLLLTAGESRTVELRLRAPARTR